MKMSRILFGSVAVSMVALMPARAENCQLSQVAAFDMVGRVDAPILLKGKIEDQSALFNIGLASNVSSISEAQADKLKLNELRLNRESIFDGKGKNANKYVNVPNFFIEDTKFKGGPFVTATGVSAEYVALASDYLDLFEIEIDPAGKKIKLFNQDHCKGGVVYWTNQYLDQEFRRGQFNQVLIPVIVNGAEINAVIDTGISRSRISEALVDGASQGSDEGASQRRTILKSFEFAGLRFKDIEVGVVKYKKIGTVNTGSRINTKSLDNFEMNIGMDILSKLHTFISYKENKIYLTLADAHK